MTILHIETGWEKPLDFNICQYLSKEKLVVLPLLLLQSIYYTAGREEYPQEDLLHQFSEKMKVFCRFGIKHLSILPVTDKSGLKKMYNVQKAKL